MTEERMEKGTSAAKAGDVCVICGTAEAVPFLQDRVWKGTGFSPYVTAVESMRL
jgi:hypothetical protein